MSLNTFRIGEALSDKLCKFPHEVIGQVCRGVNSWRIWTSFTSALFFILLVCTNQCECAESSQFVQISCLAHLSDSRLFPPPSGMVIRNSYKHFFLLTCLDDTSCKLVRFKHTSALIYPPSSTVNPQQAAHRDARQFTRRSLHEWVLCEYKCTHSGLLTFLWKYGTVSGLSHVDDIRGWCSHCIASVLPQRNPVLFKFQCYYWGETVYTSTRRASY